MTKLVSVLTVALSLISSTAFARSFDFVDISPTYTSSGQIKSVSASTTVPGSPQGFAFHSYTLNLIGAGYVAQAVLADPFANGTWYIYAEVNDVALNMDWQSDRYQVNPGDVIDLAVFRVSNTDTTDYYSWTVKDVTTGHFQTFTPTWGMRAMGFGAGARLQLEWQDGDTCARMNGTGFSGIRINEVGQYTSQWSWPQGLNAITWSASIANPTWLDFGDLPRCTFGVFIPTTPPLSFYGILEFTAN